WTAAHAGELGIDPDRLVMAGASAGGGLAAGTALMARDRGGPALTHQILMCPMLDDRGITPSSQELDGEGVWDRTSNLTGWTALLGDARGGPDVSPYAAPARARDLTGLPSAFIDVGSVETFRDEDIDYAAGLSRAGGVGRVPPVARRVPRVRPDRPAERAGPDRAHDPAGLPAPRAGRLTPPRALSPIGSATSFLACSVGDRQLVRAGLGDGLSVGEVIAVA